MIWVVSTGIALCVVFRAFITIMQKRNNREVEHNTITGTGREVPDV